MKKFFTNIPLQPEGMLHLQHYIAMGNTRLEMENEGMTRFPILAVVSGYVEPGEEFRLIAVMQNNDNVKRNYGYLKEELAALCQRKGIVCAGGVETVNGPENQTVAQHTATFQKLLDFVEEDDELFACLTYGTKPMSLAILTAVQYAYRVKRNTSISCIVYGELDRSVQPPVPRIYDETALIQLDEITRMLAERQVANPKAFLDQILSR